MSSGYGDDSSRVNLLRKVVRNEEGGWDVVDPKTEKVSSHHGREADALARAIEITKQINQQWGEWE